MIEHLEEIKNSYLSFTLLDSENNKIMSQIYEPNSEDNIYEIFTGFQVKGEDLALKSNSEYMLDIFQLSEGNEKDIIFHNKISPVFLQLN